MGDMFPASEPAKRRKRFQRDEPKFFSIEPTHVAILEALAKHRVLRTSHVILATGQSESMCKTRLTELFHAGYVARPSSQRPVRWQRNPNEQIIYALGDKGAAHLNESCGYDLPARWADKNRELTITKIREWLAISEDMIAFERACTSRAMELLTGDELLDIGPIETLKLKEPFNIRIQARERTLLPDKVFAIRQPEGKRMLFFLEDDRSTEPVQRDVVSPSSDIFKKLVLYHEMFSRGLHTAQFGFKAARVLFVTTSKERIGSMIRKLTLATENERPGAYLFATRADFDGGRADPLDFPWLNGRSEEIRLLD